MNTVSRPAITPRGIEMDETSALPFDAVGTARDLLRKTRTVSLATLDPVSGYPYTTVTNLAVEPDGTPYFFAALLAIHARNIEGDSRISMTLAPPESRDVLATPRLTLVGHATRIVGDELESAERRYLARFPKAKLYLGLPDARLYRLHMEDLTLSGGPARNAFSTLTTHSLRTDVSSAAALLSAEAAEVSRLNAKAGESQRLAARAGGVAGNWRITGIDPDGLDLQAAQETARLWFTSPVASPEELRQQLTIV